MVDTSKCQANPTSRRIPTQSQNRAHFVLASDGQRVLRGSRPKSPRGAKCRMPVESTLPLEASAGGVQRRAEYHGLHGEVGDRWESPGWERLRAKGQYVKRPGSQRLCLLRAR